MILLLRFTGLRISDVATLARDRIRDGKIMLFTGKTGGHILLPIPAEVEAALYALPVPEGGDHGYFFWNGQAPRESMGRRAWRSLRPVFKLSGVKAAKAHRFRHTLATEILVNGGTEQDCADVLGISPLVVRKHYAKWTPQRQERIFKNMRQVQSATFLLHEKFSAVTH